MLEKTGRRWLRVIHIILIAFLMGGLLSIYLISRVKGLDGQALFIANYTLYQLFNTVVTFAFYGVVTTGLIYSVFTHWGLTKHWWVIGKWMGTLLSFFIVWVWLGPALNGLVALSDAGLADAQTLDQYERHQSQTGPAILITLSIMMVLVAITIFRPWGQRTQKYALKRRTILGLTGFGVFTSLAFGIMGYLDLEHYRTLEIGRPQLNDIPDGVYQGAETYAGFVYLVDVEVKAHQLVAVNVIENRDSPYARYAEGILPRILESQHPDVDGITGATTTSKCLMKAVENALEGARK